MNETMGRYRTEAAAGKNCFSVLLQQLMQRADIKNGTMSEAVQYDISYISKWLGGKLLPSEKNIEKTVSSIVECVLREMDDATREQMQSDYQCTDSDELQNYLREALLQAFYQSKGKTGQKPQNLLTRAQFYTEYPMQRIAGEVKGSLKAAEANIAAVMDIFALDHETRLLLAGIEEGVFSITEDNRNVEFSLAMSVNETAGVSERDYVYDSIFLIHMLTSLSKIRFHIYHYPSANGKFIYAVEDKIAASCMILPGEKQGLAVNINYEPATAAELYQKLSMVTSQEMLIFRTTTMQDLISRNEYIRSILSTNVKWLIGHFNELVMPDDVFEELAEQSEGHAKEELSRLHNLLQNIMEQSNVDIMIYESVFSNLIVSGEIDFFNTPMQLTMGQRIRCLDYFLHILQKHSNVRVKLIDGGFSTDFQYITDPCLFMSDSICYLRLENGCYQNNILVLNDKSVKEMFFKFYEKVWSDRRDVVIGETSEIAKKIGHFRESALLLEKNGIM